MLGGVGESVLFSNKQTNKQTNKKKKKEKKKRGGGIWTRRKSDIDTRVHTYFETNVQKVDLSAGLQAESVVRKKKKKSVGHSNNFNVVCNRNKVF